MCPNFESEWLASILFKYIVICWDDNIFFQIVILESVNHQVTWLQHCKELCFLNPRKDYPKQTLRLPISWEKGVSQLLFFLFFIHLTFLSFYFSPYLVQVAYLSVSVSVIIFSSVCPYLQKNTRSIASLHVTSNWLFPNGCELTWNKWNISFFSFATQFS